ncbi:TetR family transcriptional regulator [Mycolicibacterium phlei]|uniref:hypothetical protein n=1 Tax=Mycobacteroides chelonae TaxID=1774 RepID=UPI000618B703|nr:hypothetical protein [Mycobacteroides chelonae]AKC37410.1 hypothetical protein GR01_00920 [Mycobacteroides chelonae]ANA96452.1 hypothetical protein BB28_00950 [Mycobacteroides chelonae CCUG 47445]OLT81407.1 hypothetical protein BKG56_04030 [Mycobacteroides chelonae]VEG14339.1 TetR family transcriptional regulator [Mycolicibacterium phlei]
MSAASRPVGRPVVFTRADIVAAGCKIGLQGLRISAVAAALGVSAAALYRHIDGRWELERLVGEELLSRLRIADNPEHDTTEHLVSFAVALRAFVTAHPGLASYMLVLFPRGESSAQLIRDQVDALGRRGYPVEVAVTIAGCVARVALSLVAADEQRSAANDGADFLAENEKAHDVLTAQGAIGPAYERRWMLTDDEYFAMLIATAVRGFVAAAPPGAPVDEVMAALRNHGTS